MWLVSAKLLLIPLVIDPLGADAYALPKTAVSRGLMYMILIVGAIYVARYGRSLRPTPLAIAVAGFLTVAAAATAVAIDSTTALYGTHRRYLGLTSILDGVVLCGAIALFVRAQMDLLIMSVAWMTAVLLNLGYESLQLLGADPVKWADRSVAAFVGNSTTLGGYLTIATVVSLGLVLMLWPRMRWPTRAALVGVTIACAGLTAWTGARAPTLALVPSAVGAAAIAWRAGTIDIRRRWVILSAGAILLTSAGLAIGPMGDRLTRLISGDPSTIERIVIYQTALSAIASRPVLGVGPDGLGAIYLQFRAPETARMTDVLTATQTSTHSWFLHYALGTGLLGVAAFLAAIYLALLRGWRRAAESDGLAAGIGAIALLAYLIQGLVTINSVVTDLMVWTALGLIAMPLVPMSASPTGPRRVYVDRLLALAAVAIGFVLAATVWNTVEANRAVHASNLARVAGNIALAQRAGQVAVDRDRGRADHWNVLGLSYSRREPERAVRAFARATEHAPRDPVYLLNLAAEEVVAYGGEPSKSGDAVTHAARAVELDPHGVVTLRRASEVFVALGRYEPAIDAARRARELLPTDPYVHQSLGIALSEAGRADEAITELELAVSLQPSYVNLPRLALPEELRLRLSRSYRSIGRIEEARSLINPPSVVRADLSCEPRNGRVTLVGGRVAPRCVRVVYTSEEDLQNDGIEGTSVRNPANYLVGEAQLPRGAIVEYDGKMTVTIQLPRESSPPPLSSVIAVRSVVNVLGQPLRLAAVPLAE